MTHRVINIKVRKEQGIVESDEEDDDFPSPDEFLQKYNVKDHEADYVEDSVDPRDVNNTKMQFSEEAVIRNISNDQSSNQRIENLLHKMDEKNREIERLCNLLEAIQPIPGLDPEKFMLMLNGQSPEGSTDYRDSKIVHLAKKCRNLTVLLNKERGLNRSQNQEVENMTRRCEKLERDLSLVASPAARAAARGDRSGDQDSNQTPEQKELLKDLTAANKQLDDLRKKYQKSQEEVKVLQRVVQKELGDGVSLEQAVDEGWRGRAQQIVMLKNKVKRLEASVASGGAVNAVRGKAKTASSDVDLKAMEALEDMSNDRKAAIEMLTEQHQQLSEEHQKVVQKLEGKKARKRNLEDENGRLKTQLKVLIEKTDSDDALIDALRNELNRVRSQSPRHQSSQSQPSKEKHRNPESGKEDPGGTRVVRAGQKIVTGGAANNQLSNMGTISASSTCTECSLRAAEIQRLNRLCSQQSEQLNTQDSVIKELRNR